MTRAGPLGPVLVVHDLGRGGCSSVRSATGGVYLDTGPIYGRISAQIRALRPANHQFSELHTLPTAECVTSQVTHRLRVAHDGAARLKQWVSS